MSPDWGLLFSLPAPSPLSHSFIMWRGGARKKHEAIVEREEGKNNQNIVEKRGRVREYGEGCTRFLLPCRRELEKAMAPHSSTLAWKIPRAEEPGRLQSMGSLRVGLSDFTFTFHFPALEKEMATHSSVLAWRIPGTEEPGGLLSMGSHRVRHDDTT